MILSLKRINAIFIKDWKDLLKNSYILSTFAMPILFAAMLGRMDAEGPAVYTLPINLALVICGAFIQAAMVAEEKEKNTLRSLLLSPANIGEVFIGKSALSAVVTIIAVALTISISDFQVPDLSLFLLVVLLNIIIFISIGTALGLVSRSVMETTIIGIPVLAVFGMGSMVKGMFENDFLLELVSYLPSEQLNTVAIELNNGGGMTAIQDNLLVLLVWAVISIAVCVITFKKRRFDK
ncbi:ABC transporter permease [Halobacillus sp. MO56]